MKDDLFSVENQVSRANMSCCDSHEIIDELIIKIKRAIDELDLYTFKKKRKLKYTKKTSEIEEADSSNISNRTDMTDMPNMLVVDKTESIVKIGDAVLDKLDKNCGKTEVCDENEIGGILKSIIDTSRLCQITKAFKDIYELIEMNEENEMKKAGLKESKKFFLPAFSIAPPFFDLLLDIEEKSHKEYVLYGGRGSCKSSFISLIIIYLLKNNCDIHVLACRMVGRTLKDSVFSQLKWAVNFLNLNDEFIFKTSPLEIIYKKTGQKIFFRGADNVQKLKSIKPEFGYIGIVWFEELDQFGGCEEIRNIEQSVIRGGNDTVVFKSFNPPKTQNNWANKYLKNNKKSCLIHYSSYLNVPVKWLGDTFLSDADHLKSVNKMAYDHEYLGVATGTGGAVFDNVILRKIDDDEKNNFERFYRGVDWGWYPDPNRYHLVAFEKNTRILYVLDEISCNKTSNEEFADLLKAHSVSFNDKITADSSEKKTISDFKNIGFLMYGAKKGSGSIDYSMKWLQSLSQIVIDETRCPFCATEFLEYEYDKSKNGDIISGYPDKNNHSIDAIRYATEEIWGRRE